MSARSSIAIVVRHGHGPPLAHFLSPVESLTTRQRRRRFPVSFRVSYLRLRPTRRRRS